MAEENFENLMDMARALLGGFENVNDLWQANQYVNLALRERIDDVEGWILKSQLLSALEDEVAALAAAEMALRYAPNSAECRYIKASVLADMELYDEALLCIDHAFAACRDRDEWLLEELYFEKAAILEAMNLDDEAMALLEVGLNRCPNSPLLNAGIEPLRREKVRRKLKVIEGGLGVNGMPSAAFGAKPHER
jgi:tetratricopeptide (TPR) repeat protein